jgi:hypothetical protein
VAGTLHQAAAHRARRHSPPRRNAIATSADHSFAAGDDGADGPPLDLALPDPGDAAALLMQSARACPVMPSHAIVSRLAPALAPEFAPADALPVVFAPLGEPDGPSLFGVVSSALPLPAPGVPDGDCCAEVISAADIANAAATSAIAVVRFILIAFK